MPATQTDSNDLTVAQYALKTFMSELSEDAYCEGWTQDLEYILWSLIVGDGMYLHGRWAEISAQDLKFLWQCAQQARGWFIYEFPMGPTFLPRDQWMQRYELHKEVHEARGNAGSDQHMPEARPTEIK